LQALTPRGELERRISALEDERSILLTMYAYGHSLDYGVEEEFLDCFAEDAVLHWAVRGTFAGREAIRGAFRDHTHAPERYHKHLLIEPRIALDGDRAAATSYFVRIDRYDDGPKVRNFGRYFDSFVRGGDGRWRFAERRAESEANLPDPPGMRA
jgi:ketosteroid isomerase-like protein